MHGSAQRLGSSGWTRARALRSAIAAGAAVGGGVLLSRRRDAGASPAGPSTRQDAEILAFFLQLEQVQEDFYKAALHAGGLGGAMHHFARTVGPQETQHVRMLAERVGDRARPRLRSDFGAALRSDAAARRAAIDLEELTIGAYIGQGANLTRDAIVDAARIVSVEARQAAWLRDLAGEVPAPRPADPSHEPEQILAALRGRGLIA
jgi:Ferritin-like domain